MRIRKPIIFLIPIILLLVLVSNCEKSAVKQPGEPVRYASFRDVPGVTEDEITAIEALQKEYGSFVYGMPLSVEAFAGRDGEVRGYTALFCEWLTELFGITFQPRLYSWPDLLAGLQARDISFSGELTANEERRKIYYMTGDIASRPLKHYRLADSRHLEEIAKERPIRCGFIEGAAAVYTIADELESISYESVMLKDVSLVYDALKSGKIDAFYYSSTAEASFIQYGDLLALNFYPLIYQSVSFTTQDPALLPIISVVEKILKDGGIRHLTRMYNQGYQEYLAYKMNKQLTEEEHAYINSRPVVPIGIDPGNYPGCFYDKREKKWRGVFLDILNEITLLTGLTFERVNDEHTEWPVINQMLNDGEIALVPELTQSAERAGQFLWPSTMQLTDNYALISKYDYPDIKVNEVLYVKVGLAKNTAYTAIFRKWFSNHMNNIEYESMEEAFDALKRGDIDMVMANQKRLLYLTHYLELPDYKANVVFDQSFIVNIGLNKDETVLCSIISKALSIIDSKSISDNWMRKTYDYRSRLVEAQRPWLIGLSVLTLCVLVLVAVFFVRSRRTGIRLGNLVRERTYDLELQTSMLMTIFNSSPDYIFCKDLELRYMRCNKSMENFLNISMADIIGKNDMEVFGFSPEAAEGWDDKKVIESKQPVAFEEYIISQSDGGKKMIVETIKAPLIQDNEVIGVMGISRDITKRKETENALALQTAKLQAILDSIPDIFFCKDLNLRYTQCNKVTEEYNGVKEKDIIGKNDIDAFGFPADVTKRIMEADLAVLEKGRKIVIEETIPYYDGVKRIMETVRAPLVQDGKIIGLIVIARDITKRKEEEEALLSASRSKSAFLANMSHEIRTPMNSIVGFSELALDGDIPPKTKDYLNKILENSQWLLQIINDILDISKIESGKMELENIPFDIHELFASCRTLIMPKAVEKGIMLYFYAEPSIGKRPLGDPTRLRQILVNLLSNAVKFTNTGMVKLHASIKSISRKNITMHFEVKDSGIGMTSEQMEKVFDPFMQAETGTTRKYGGTGLGLAITKNIVEMMGGNILVESTPGVGSKFSFTLTFDTVDVSDNDMFENKIVFNELEKPVFEGEILLCEDNAMNQQVICEHLARVGIKTVVAENGKTGVEMVQSRKEKGEKQFDLIFMDMHMPVMDGLEAASRILELNTGIPIVAMTANIMSNDREIYKTSGMNDCVGKPFTSQELWRCLMKYLVPVSMDIPGKKTHIEADMEFQKSLQLYFVRSNQKKYDEIVKALEAHDIKLAHRLAHTLKGNAGQIGKTILQKAAADIEHQLKDGENLATSEQLKILETELNAVLNELSPLLEESSRSNAEIEPLDSQSIRELIEKLEPLLKMGNPECRKLINGLRRIPGSGELIQYMDDLDFEPALVTLAGLKKKLEM